MTANDTHADLIRDACQNRLCVDDYGNLFAGHDEAALDALDSLVSALDEAEQEAARWLAWSEGRYPDDSVGDVIAFDVDGTVTLDDGITTWNPLRALMAAEQRIQKQDARWQEMDRPFDKSEYDGMYARMVAAEQRAQQTEAKLDERGKGLPIRWDAERIAQLKRERDAAAARADTLTQALRDLVAEAVGHRSDVWCIDYEKAIEAARAALSAAAGPCDV